MLHMSHPLVLVDAFSGLLFVNKVLLPCVADKWHSVCENKIVLAPLKFLLEVFLAHGVTTFSHRNSYVNIDR